MTMRDEYMIETLDDPREEWDFSVEDETSAPEMNAEQTTDNGVQQVPSDKQGYVSATEPYGFLQTETGRKMYFGPKRSDWERMRAMFSGADPYALIADPEIKEDLKKTVRLMLDPAAEERKLAVAAYMSRMKREDMSFVYNNLDGVLNAYYGRETKVDEAFKDISGMLLGAREQEKDGLVTRTAKGVAAKTAVAAKTFYGFLAQMGKMMQAQNQADLLARGIDPERYLKSPEEVEKQVLDFYQAHYGKTEEWLREGSQVPEDWMTNSESFGDWCGNAVVSLIGYMPELGVQMGVTTMGGLPALGVMYGLNKYTDLTMQNPEMAERMRLLNAAGTGTVNAVMEKVTLGIIDGKITKKWAVDGIKAGFLRASGYFGWSMTKEAAEEAAEQLAENLIDIYSGVYGDYKAFTPEEWKQHLKRGVCESAFLGGVTGGAMAAGPYLSYRALDQYGQEARNSLQGRERELLQKEDLTEQETAELRHIQTTLETGNINQAVGLSQEVAQTQEARRRADAEAAVERDAEMTSEERADAARQDYQLRRSMAHNPEDTADAVAETGAGYKVNVRACGTAEIASMETGRNAEEIRAFYDPETDTVVVNTDRVRPSEVPYLFLHEVAVHKGLDAVFGESRKNAVLDGLYGQMHEQIEAVNTGYGFDLDTTEGRRAATEEYLAECAEFCGHDWRKFDRENEEDVTRWLAEHNMALMRRKEGVRGVLEERGELSVRPAWWREFLQKVKMFFYGFKGFSNYRFTDREIETLLLRGYRKTRNARGAKAEGGEMRFSIDGETKIFSLSELLQRFKDELSGTELNAEQQGIYDVVTGESKKTVIRKEDLEILEEFVLLKGGRGKGAKKIIQVHYAGIRGPVTALEIVNIGDVIRRGTYIPGDEAHPTSRSYELTTDDGARLRVVVDYDKQKNKSVINFYSNRKNGNRAHEASSGSITDSRITIAPESGKVKHSPEGGARFSIIGEEGAGRGREAEARMSGLRIAREMEAAGKDAKTIKRATGWERGGDGKWRMEIPDLKIKREETLPDGTTYAKSEFSLKFHDGTLGEYVDAPELFEAYPELRNIRLAVRPEEMSDTGFSYGYFDKSGNMIVVYSDVSHAEEFLVHEVQHAIQALEGFPGGGDGREMGAEYWKLAGEVEAYNAAKRRKMTAEEKRESLLEETADVAEEDKIYLTGADGLEHSFTETTSGKRPYYQIPFSEGLARVVDPAQKDKREPVFVCATPEILRKIGFTELPIMMNARHLRLNYYTAEEFRENYGNLHKEDHAHGLHEALKTLPKVLEHPLAVVVNMTENAKPGSVVVITDMDIGGKKVVVPVLIETVSNTNKGDIDSHLVLTVYDSKDWINTFLKPALEEEKKNRVGIFYFDEKKASRYSVLSKNKKTITAGYLHTIHDEGSPVKGNFKKQTETLQFKEWFGKSKVVDEEGKPLVVYHGSTADFTEFSYKFVNRNGQADGRGFYFTDNRSFAEGYQNKDGKLFEVYLSIQKPLNPDKLTITKAELRKILDAIDPSGDYMANYAEDDRGYPGAAWRAKALNSTVNAIYDSSENNADILAELYSSFGGGEVLAEVRKVSGYDGFIKKDQNGNMIYIAFEPGQIKSATDNIGTYDRNNPDIRFSIEQYSDADWSDMVTYMRSKVGDVLNHPDSDYRRILEEAGMRCYSDADAHACAAEAMQQNERELRERGKKRRDDWIYENELLYRLVVDFARSDKFTLVPDSFTGEKFTGSWIAEEYRKYSEKRAQKPTESDKQYKRYLQTREKALARAKGYRLDEVAEAIARKTGRDMLEVQEELVDYFRDLKKTDLYHRYSEWRKNHEFDSRRLTTDLEEYEELQYEMAEEAIIALIEEKREVTPGWISANRKAYNLLYKRVFGKDAPRGKAGAKDIADLNAKLAQDKGDMAAFAAGIKEGRAQLLGEYLKKLGAFKKMIVEDWRNIGDVQYAAKKFAYENVDAGFRDKFISGIIRLSRFSAKGSKAYPDGRRAYEFDRLCEAMVSYQREVTKEKAIREIREMLDANRTKRTDKNVPYSPMRERQTALDRIAQIVRMDAETVQECQRYAGERISKAQEALDKLPEEAAEGADGKTELEAEAESAQREIWYLNHFGALGLKDAEFVEKSRKMLKEFIKTGREEFRAEMLARREEVEALRSAAIREMSGGDETIPSNRDLDRKADGVSDYLMKSVSLPRLLDWISRSGNEFELEKSVAGKMMNLVEDSTRREKRRMNEMQSWFDRTLKDECGVKGIVEKGRFLNGALKEEDTGVPLIQYGTVLGEKDHKVAHWDMGRAKRTDGMRVEHCRKMLEDLKNGKEVAGYIGIHDVELSKSVRSGLKESGVKTGRFYSVCTTKEGFRIYTENESGETIGLDLRREDAPAELKALQEDKRNVLEISDITREGAKRQIQEYDAGASAAGRKAVCVTNFL